MELENFGAALEALIASGAPNYGDGESMEKLHHLEARFDFVHDRGHGGL